MSSRPYPHAPVIPQEATSFRQGCPTRKPPTSCIMHFLYVDESGDTGAKPGSSSHFILCGLLIHHASWHHARQATKAMRQRLEDQFGVPQQAELHASEFLSKNGMHFGLPLEVKIKCALHAVGFLRKNKFIRPIRIIADKADFNEDVFGHAWNELLAKANDERTDDNDCPANGLIVICDDHRTAPKRDLVRRLPAALAGTIIDLPFGLDSRDSNFLQLADLSAYLSKQEIAPSATFEGRLGFPLLRRNAELYFSGPK